MAETRGEGTGAFGSLLPAAARQLARARRSKLLVAFGLVVSAVLLAAIFWSVPLGAVGSALLRIDRRVVLAAMSIVTVSFWIRGWRWALLLRPRHRARVAPATALVAVGLALNAVLPGKVGEVARVALASRRFRCGWAFAAATIAGERLLDGVALLLLLGVALVGVPVGATDARASLFGYSLDAAAVSGLVQNLIVACLLLCVLIAALISQSGRRLLLWLLRPLPRLHARLEKPLAEVGRGLDVFRSPPVLLAVLSQSVVVWLIPALAALVLAAGTPGIELGGRQALGLTALAIAASALPSSPGSWGVFEAAALLGLALFSVSFEQSTAVAFVLILHLVFYLPVVVCGAVAAVAWHLSPGELRGLGGADAQRDGRRVGIDRGGRPVSPDGVRRRQERPSAE